MERERQWKGGSPTWVWLTVGIREWRGIITKRSEVKKTNNHQSTWIMNNKNKSKQAKIKLIHMVTEPSVRVCDRCFVCVCVCIHTGFEHLLGHEQVVEAADVVPARQEDQDGSFLRRQQQQQTPRHKREVNAAHHTTHSLTHSSSGKTSICSQAELPGESYKKEDGWPPCLRVSQGEGAQEHRTLSLLLPCRGEESPQPPPGTWYEMELE